MPTLNHPPILTDLGHVGANGLPLNTDPFFQEELAQCEKWGFKLEYANDRVKLVFNPDQLVPYWIQKETPEIAWEFLRVKGFLSVESTNSEALLLARQGAPGGTLVLSEEQTAGKGRNGRSWFSSAGKGLFFTLVLRPQQPLQFWPLLTHAASVALVQTLDDFFSSLKAIPRALDLDIKWPNDVLVSGRKCAGILLEALTDGKQPAAVVGLGINVREGSVPEALQSTAVCLDEACGTQIPRRRLLVRFLQNFQESYLLFERGKHVELLDRWKSRSSMWDGVPVSITDGDRSRNAVTCGLDEIGALIVRTPEGNQETILAGDIHVSRQRD